jgi:hypothetical protein
MTEKEARLKRQKEKDIKNEEGERKQKEEIGEWEEERRQGTKERGKKKKQD